MRLTFPRAKVIELLEHAEAATDRMPTLEQIVTPENWRDDLDHDRRVFLEAEAAAKGFAFSARSTDVDPAKIVPGLILVGDQGVYLMSNGKPGLPMVPRGANVAYANEVNPLTMEFDDWWNAKRASFGGDDGTHAIPAEVIRAHLPGEGDLVMKVTPDSITLLPPQDDGPQPG